MRTAFIVITLFTLSGCATPSPSPGSPEYMAAHSKCAQPHEIGAKYYEDCPVETGSVVTTDVSDDNKNWCQRNAPACAPLIPLMIPFWVGSAIGNDLKSDNSAIRRSLIDSMANTNVYSSSVKTPHGRYDSTTICTYGNCDTTIEKR